MGVGERLRRILNGLEGLERVAKDCPHRPTEMAKRHLTLRR